MKNRAMAVVAVALLACSPALFAQQGRGSGNGPAAKEGTKFDPHDLNGSWIGTQQFFGDDNPVPEPPLTSWAREHLLMKSISHTGLNLTSKGESSTSSSLSGITDANGVPANVPEGHYPGEHCEPLGVPVQFNGTHYYPFQFIILHDRIYQMFEKPVISEIRLASGRETHLWSTRSVSMAACGSARMSGTTQAMRFIWSSGTVSPMPHT